MKDILLVEDNLEVAKEIKLSLEKWGMQVQLIEDFSNVLEEVVRKQPKLVLMDVNLPYYDGFYWCGRIREVSNLPILFLSSRDSNMDVIMGINNGGDDYITKPFDTQVLLSKINALLRRAYQYTDAGALLYYNDAVLDIDKCELRYKGNSLELTKNEIKILTLLIRNKGKVVSRDKIMMSLWNDDEFISDNTLTVNMTRLRSKMKEIGLEEVIKTKKGLGYMM
ncbi:response regulator transcription factor [Cellulosilyticum sp. ST5]|uniref:Stage 0 sporulation protein A homolog n=1 Tax=Cellulosilyticum lentocellum (strain ATCC 49066 / DSM 5427 / NCIMB 11756 / RHM5) TaxID=642492 RepID=F2JJR3_CELLD|nr:response regulator transcription factor [Cellulosilyticum lentocellum]ADZ82105.1 two component transcriptional regulator, winged helix family [Cellulosilyticum lentocellum DSM 5427]